MALLEKIAIAYDSPSLLSREGHAMANKTEE